MSTFARTVTIRTGRVGYPVNILSHRLCDWVTDCDMQKLDLSAHYSLTQAFDLTGRRFFGDDWSGMEPWTRRADDPQASQNERAALSEEIVRLELSKSELSARINYAVDAADKEDGQAKYIAASDQLRKLEDRFRHFPASYDHWITTFDGYQRRSKVETLLLEAFGAGELQIYYAGNRVVCWEDWRHRPGFKLYMNLSMIRVPRSERSRSGIVQCDQDSLITPEDPYWEPTRYAAFVRADEFKQWSGKFQYAPDPSETFTPEEQCRALLKQWVTAHVGNPLKKQDCWRDVKKRLPNLSEAAFKRVWALETPGSWRIPGRKV